ncbi:MAG: hypothetical protein AAGL24_21010 [Pseudomonadota bacterium]
MTADLLGTVQFACLALGALLAVATILVAWQQAHAHRRLTGRTHFGVADTNGSTTLQTAGAHSAEPRQKVVRFRSRRAFAPSGRVLCPVPGLR